MRRPLLATLALLLLLFCLPACLDTQRQYGLRYDPSKDEFHVLRVYYHIRAESDAEVKYLAALYNNRDHLLLFDPIALFKEYAALRLQDGKYRILSIGEPPDSAPAAEATDLDLKSVQIQPGKFFLSADNTACYYQQSIVPGALADKLLTKLNVEMQKGLAEQIATELEHRTAGSPMGTIADLRRGLLHQLDQLAAPEPATQPAPAQAATEPATQPGNDLSENPLIYLSTDSLKLLQQSCKDGSLALSRKGSVVGLAVHISPEDAQAIQALLLELKQKFPAVLAKQTDPDKKKQGSAALQLANLFALTAPANGQFTLSLDALKFVETASSIIDIEPIDKARADGYARVVTGLQAAGVVMDPNLKLEQIIPSFQKGVLPVDPPAHSRVPGDGIFPDPAATAPNQPA